MKKVADKNVAITSGIICILLAASLVGVIANYTSIINAKDNTLTNQDSIINNLNSQITSKNTQLTENNNTIASLNSQKTLLNAQISNRDSQIDTLTSQKDQLQIWLDGNITALNAQITDYQSQVISLNYTVDSLNSQIETLQNQPALDKATISSLQSQVAAANSQINSLNSQITTLQSQASTDQFTISNLQSQAASTNSQINSLTSTTTSLQSQVNGLTAIINMSKSTKLKTLIFHVSEKEWTHIPNPNSTYNRVLILNKNAYNILLLPEYMAHKNWTQELSWLTTNFGGQQGIPIMLDVFNGGNWSTPTPMLSTDDIVSALAVCNVQYLRFAEVISWHMEHPELPFPTAYVASVLSFCRANGLKLFWTEWKEDNLPSVETFKAIQTYIKGYEDIVTVSFSTNSKYVEPADGFMQISKMFQHWGGSIQAWYWEERYNTTLLNMPISTLIQHALIAKNMGAEILQFEPYWYFFNNGQPNENLRLLETMLTS